VDKQEANYINKWIIWIEDS